jgi:hypothetical protein
MADLNALIAQGYQFQPPSDPFVQYGRMQQLEQGQQTNQLNRMKMQEAERSMEETNALRRLDPASETYLQDVTRISPEKGFAFAKSRQDAKTAETEGQIKRTKLVADKLALLPDAYRMADTPEAYLAVHKSVHADPVLGPYLQSLGATPEKGLAQLDEAVQTGKFDQFRMRSMQSVSQLLDSVKPVVVAPSASVYQGGAFSQAPAAPEKPVQPKLHVVGRNLVDETGKVVFKAQPELGTGVPKAPLGYRVTATGDLEAIPGGPAAGKPMTEAQIIKLRTDVGKDYKNASTALSQIDDLLASATSVRTAPGLSAATGFTGMLPSFSEGAAAQAETRLANLRGKVTALGKATAAMGGAIGSIANQEWKILADQIAVLNEVKGKGPLLEQIALLEEQAKGASERIRDAYEKTRADDFERFPQFRDLPAPKAPSGKPIVSPNIDALLDKYLNKQK